MDTSIDRWASVPPRQTELSPHLSAIRSFLYTFLPHMTDILQPLDRSCFGHAEILYRRQICRNFYAGLSPTKAHFFETYQSIRKEECSPQNHYRKGWRKCRLSKIDPDIALDKYKRHMNHDIITPEHPVQEESVIEPEVGNISTPQRLKRNSERKKRSIQRSIQRSDRVYPIQITKPSGLLGWLIRDRTHRFSGRTLDPTMGPK